MQNTKVTEKSPMLITNVYCKVAEMDYGLSRTSNFITNPTKQWPRQQHRSRNLAQGGQNEASVSYTHLTLPTIYSV